LPRVLLELSAGQLICFVATALAGSAAVTPSALAPHLHATQLAGDSLSLTVDHPGQEVSCKSFSACSSLFGDPVKAVCKVVGDFNLDGGHVSHSLGSSPKLPDSVLAERLIASKDRNSGQSDGLVSV